MPLHKIKLLLVDDDADLRKVLSIILTMSGYDVRLAEDGFTGLAAIREEMPDILLSDLYMAEMSGFEFLSVVRRRFPLLPVIAMSSAYSGNVVPDGVAADVFYEKATDLRDLLAMMNGMCDTPQTEDERNERPAVPIWIARSGKGTKRRTHVTLACPECLRTFSELIDPGKQLVYEAGCVHCMTPVSYALVGLDGVSKPVSVGFSGSAGEKVAA